MDLRTPHKYMLTTIKDELSLEIMKRLISEELTPMEEMWVVSNTANDLINGLITHQIRQTEGGFK